mmetsp:Transcript_25813/g.24647  ORF Transcript_25813/g.24647 Transcript_25813/m.24647 type:complete len:1282 (+) Transcript_25813:133-3978(+)|eukprot:CAMPEP_0119040258 /NCGR_PEP_ID=MMETSP1177-20130426/10126_1 /TAXON_ID=2985 /ORGANISM="Ochromonas sp, Strain CCMP1899" /LENGTH=1281 /DNA_ID=CAMNT_0007005129 /DNA_START=87 /DNA_END=3932 /DNA_ORIENTATION=+
MPERKKAFDRGEGADGNGYTSDNGDGCISEIQTQNSNNSSVVSQDFYSSTRLVEQHFKEKYRFLRDAYEQRVRQLTEVVNLTCENLFSDELLLEMRNDRTSSAFIPAHLGEVINKHLESDRETFIHQVITQLSTVKVDLLKSQETVIFRNRTIANLEPEVLRGKKAEGAISNLQRQLLDLKQTFDRSGEDSKAIETKNIQLVEQNDQLQQKIEKLSIDFTARSQEMETLKSLFDDNKRDSLIVENNFDRAVDKEVASRLSPLSDERNNLSVEVNEVKVQLRFSSDELIRTQGALKLKTEDEIKSKEQVSAIMSQVEVMLEQEASESNKTIMAIHDKMKQSKSRFSLELQQERRLNAVLQEELGNVRRDKEDKARDLKIAVDEKSQLGEKLSLELQRGAVYQIKIQETSNGHLDARGKLANAEARLKIAEEELKNVLRLKEQELKVEVARVKMEALSELEGERGSIEELVEQRTAEYKRNNENQLKSLQNQMRHSYTFGSRPQEHKNSNQAIGNDSSLVTDISMQFALRSAEEKSHVEKAKSESAHRELVAELQERLHEAAGNIEMLKKMIVKGKNYDEDKIIYKEKITDLETEVNDLKGVVYKTQQECVALVERLRSIEENKGDQALVGDLQTRLSSSLQAHNIDTKAYEVMDKKRTEEYDYLSSQLKHTMETSTRAQARIIELEANLNIQTNDSDKHHKELQANVNSQTNDNSERSRMKETKIEVKESNGQISSNEEALELEISNLKKLLNETQEQALIDHAQDEIALKEMNRKFENLMRNYDNNVSAVSHKLDSSNAQSIYSEEIVEAQMSTIKSLEQTLRHKNEMSETANEEVQFERGRSRDSRKKAQKMYETIVIVENHHKNQLRELRMTLSSIKEAVEIPQSQMEENIRKIAQAYSQKIQIFSENMEMKKESDIQAVKISLSNAHSIEIKLLESMYIGKLANQTSEFQAKEKLIRSDLLDRISSASGKTNHGYSDTDISSAPGDIRKANHGYSDTSGTGMEEVHSQEILVPTPVPAYESVMKGVIHALEGSGILSKEGAEEVSLLATSNDQPSFIASSSAKNKINECVYKLIDENKKLKFENNSIQNEIDMVNEAQRGRYSGVMSGHSQDFSEINSVITGNSKAAFDVAVGELEQARHEQGMLLDLARIESEAQVKSLLARIDDLQKESEMEVANVKAEASESEHLLKLSFKEDQEAYKIETFTLINNIKNELMNEQSRKQQLQAHLSQSESQFFNQIQKLEEKIIFLQNKVEQADLEATKIRMKFLHNKTLSDSL